MFSLIRFPFELLTLNLFLLASRLFNSLCGHVAGSGSVSGLPERRGNDLRFPVCGDVQVLWCYCEECKTSSMDALLVNV